MAQDDEQDPWARFKELPEHEQFLIQALKGVEAQQQEIRYQYQLETLELSKKVERSVYFLNTVTDFAPASFHSTLDS
jgi:hypothetical protein